MKKNRLTNNIIIIPIFIISVLVVTICYIVRSSSENLNKNITTSETQVQAENWYEISESQNYKILHKGGETILLNKSSDTILIPNESCEIQIPPSDKSEPKTPYFNNSVGIKILGPYKSIIYDENTADTFVQTVQNAGCVSEEGRISLIKSVNPREIDCKIEINYKHLGC